MAAPRLLSVLRIITALIFLEHGTQRLVGGVLLLLGLFTRPVVFIASGEMAFAYFISHAPRNFFPAVNGGDAAILYCFVFLYMAAAGGRVWSLDRARERGTIGTDRQNVAAWPARRSAARRQARMSLHRSRETHHLRLVEEHHRCPAPSILPVAGATDAPVAKKETISNLKPMRTLILQPVGAGPEIPAGQEQATMSRLTPIVAAIAGPLALAACAVAPPTGPNVLVLPSEGKDLARFQQEDSACRGYAQQQIGFGSPQQVANQSAIGSAAVGTGVGAAAGALLGAAAGNAGAGAAIGAGGGLLAGSAVGTSNAQISAGNLQQRYDVAYVQCMAASGNKLPTTAEGEPYLFAPYSYSGAYPAYYGYYGYPYYGPYFGGAAISLGFFGHRHFPHFHHPWGGFRGGWGGFHGGWHGGGGRHR